MSSAWRKRAAAFLHDVASRTVASLIVTGILALATGGALFWWRADLARWFRGRTFVENWAIAVTGVVVAGLVIALAVYVRKYRWRCSMDAALARPWVIRDSGIDMEWQLRRRPESWMRNDLDTQSAVVDSILLGPYHSRPLDETGELCLEELTIRTGEVPVIATECPRCSRMVYDDWKGTWTLRWLKTRTLKSLRRDIQNGKRVRSGYSGDFVGPYIGS
jgi:hypothetical protein